MKRLALRRPDRCVACGTELAAGTVAIWDREARMVTCLVCADQPGYADGDPTVETDPALAPEAPALPEIERGQPGASLDREHDRRRAAREKRIRERHPRIGGFLLALNGEPQHQAAFHQGAEGERAVADSLDKRTPDGPTILLYNRRMPGDRGDIDVIAVSPTGVFVIDAKDVAGRVELRRPWFAGPKLLVAGRDRTKYIGGLDRQVAVVRDALAAGGHDDISVQGVLGFTRADLPMLGTLEMRGHLLLYRKALAKRLNADGPLHRETIDAIARCLAAGLKPA